MMGHPEIIVGKDAKILRGRADRVEKIDASIRELVQKMRRIMQEAGGIGLAAPQIGVPLQIFVAELNKKFYALINPEILKISKDKEEMEEGCLSLPGFYGPVERPSKITIAATDLRGKRVKIKAWGLLARVFQHEIDHLNGTLFVDKAKEVRKYEYENTKRHEITKE
jgi:peptide deformylase